MTPNDAAQNDTNDETIPVRVVRAAAIALDIHTFEFVARDGGDLPAFAPGAHVGVHLPGGVIRKYSLCNDNAERDRYVIAVKRERGGRGGSEAMIREVTEGAEVMLSPPRNDFELVKSAAGHLFIAGGIGITPVMSMVRRLKADGGKFKLYYCTRAAEATAFLDVLSAPEFRGQVTFHHDGGDAANALDLWPVLETPAGRQLYCCGPRGLMDAVRDMSGHWPTAAVHFEAFTEAGEPKPQDKPFRVRLEKSGRVIDVPVGVTILEALRGAGLTVPSSCESGSCGTCRTRLVAGEADHRDLVLAEDERADTIMVCVSRAKSDELVIDR